MITISLDRDKGVEKHGITHLHVLQNYFLKFAFNMTIK